MGACSLLVDILWPNAMPRAQAGPSRSDTTKEARVVLQAVVEPIILGFEADQNPGRLAHGV
jgi:hypothetical protein